jgi:hypothetical protein
VRVPGSLHSTGFVSRVTRWSPSRVWDLEDLLPQMGVEQVYPERYEVDTAPGKYKKLGDVRDPVYHWLVDQGMVTGHNNQWVHILCPWRDEHTGAAQGATATSYSPEHYHTEPPAFSCLHGHCTERRIPEFRAWLEAQGCVVSWGDDDHDSADISARLKAALEGLNK